MFGIFFSPFILPEISHVCCRCGVEPFVVFIPSHRFDTNKQIHTMDAVSKQEEKEMTFKIIVMLIVMLCCCTDHDEEIVKENVNL